nr:ASN_HP1_G0005040.mRNA.1.CDS.1 [Saccharomyces cerevisiae]
MRIGGKMVVEGALSTPSSSKNQSCKSNFCQWLLEGVYTNHCVLVITIQLNLINGKAENVSEKNLSGRNVKRRN